MVRILANGDIVQDDDPRVRKAPPRREELNRGRQGYIHNTENAYQPHQRPANQGHSLFSDMNQRLINMGFPRWNLGNQVIEPIMSVLLVLMLVLFGVRGLVLIGGLYLFSQFAQR
ncbi:protein FAM241B-like [Narcine bancroftii]|uniref:protein FAM241B-like n=1 Tax=Narcine bancroftii TaxID=1343680 RepID=UPI0038310E1A